MFEFIVGVVVGVVVGWSVPEPLWVADLIAKIKEKFKQ